MGNSVEIHFEMIELSQQQISNCELELMKIIWGSKGKALYADLVKALEEKGTPWTKNTIITLCRNEYTSVISEAEYQATQTQDFLEKIYEGDAKGLVATLLQKDLLSCEEYEDLKRHWERGGGSK